MKRRTSRRQVLDLDTNSSSPKRSWQTKYQQICMDHKNSLTVASVDLAEGSHNGAVPIATSNAPTTTLPQLVGYASDSEDENKKGDLDSKVEDFLKEISEIVPTEEQSQGRSGITDSVSIPKTAKKKAKVIIGPMPMKQNATASAAAVATTENYSEPQPTMAWQECYDEGSGCYYYWNTETNEVTWEMPAEVRAYRLALEQWNARQLLLAQQAVGGLVPMYADSQPQSKKRRAAGAQSGQGAGKTNNKHNSSDSEDEKIELITSYGPTSDDEDSDSPPPATKKKKSEVSKQVRSEVAIGPELPPGYVATTHAEKSNSSKGENAKKIKIKLGATPDPKPVVAVTPEPKPSSVDSEKNAKDILSVALKSDSKKITALQRLKTLKNKDSEDSNSSSEESVQSNEGLKSTSKKVSPDNDNSNSNSIEDDMENCILERLKNKAKILQELGGEIPEEIKELLEPEQKVKSPTPDKEGVDMDVDEPIVDLTAERVGEESQDNILKTMNQSNDTLISSKDILKEKSPPCTKSPPVVEISTLGKIQESEKNLQDEAMCNIEEMDLVEENSSESDKSKQIEINTKIPIEKAPTSFALIASYGNEEDSDEEKADEKLKANDKPTPLFPIVEHEKEKPTIKSNRNVIKLSAKAKELIHSSTTTEKARATDFVATVEGLRPASSLVKETFPITENEFIEPVKRRKKRLEVPVIVPKVKVTVAKTDTEEETKEDSAKNDDKEANTKSSTAYTETWAYNSELKGGEHRGFGYGVDYNSEPRAGAAAKKGMIQFVKSDTLIPINEARVVVPEKTLSELDRRDDEDLKQQREQAQEMADLILEKVQFLSEGKEAVPPVQVMAIQVETLTAALAASGLSVNYLVEWLESRHRELASLERAAAPAGWQTHWDRSYKRYYYRNDVTGAIQWEYPVTVSNVAPPPPPEPEVSHAQGGEEAMELCDSPPPPPLPVTPPPPRISTRSPSPEPQPPPPPPVREATPPPLPPMPPPPPVISELPPPLPPLPPSESPPPPPPPPIISDDHCRLPYPSGEPLPPGVDPPEEMFDSAVPPLPVAPPPPPPTYSMGYDMPMHYDHYQMQPVSEYAPTVYQPQQSAYSSGGENYVIERPAAATRLSSELDSFYSEVAALEPLPPPPPTASPSPPPPQPPPPEPAVTACTDVVAEPVKKKKKTKLTPGLALKKKGVSSLVAKWQQVQQDVRREEASEET